jgi:glutaredoxin
MLELYQAESCPHSTEVRRTLTDRGVSYVVHNPRLPGDEGGDVRNSQTHRELVSAGGQDQIPLLVDTGRELRLESSAEQLLGVDRALEPVPVPVPVSGSPVGHRPEGVRPIVIDSVEPIWRRPYRQKSKSC